ncbi:MAG: pentapeptide repeat-containing protein [Candidatus Nomurabacteria bacterium]|nr:MAG: pentapeptide repeat-containing protein [Candidatus Nomurabacteria bacterium]
MDIAFKQCLISTCDFSSLKLKRTPFLQCRIQDVTFYATDLTEVDFSGSDLAGSRFRQCDFNKADLSRAKITKLILRKTK